MTRYRQDAETGKLIEIVKVPRSRQHFIGGFESFVSSIDGSTISNSQDLKNHNRQHGVSNDPDSLREQKERQMNREHHTGTREERKAAIRDSIERVQSSGYHRRKQYDE